MIDLEVNDSLYRFHRGLEVTPETMALDVIAELEFCSDRTYLESEHTARHFRQVGWQPRFFDRRYCDHNAPAVIDDQPMLDQADQAWRKLVAQQEPLAVDPSFVRDLDRITAAARKELLGCE